jgi:hypothetical protein
MTFPTVREVPRILVPVTADTFILAVVREPDPHPAVTPRPVPRIVD